MEVSDQSVSDGGEVGEGGISYRRRTSTSQSTATRPVALTHESVA